MEICSGIRGDNIVEIVESDLKSTLECDDSGEMPTFV